MFGPEIQKISNSLFMNYWKYAKVIEEACKQNDCYCNHNFIDLVSFLCCKKYTAFSMKVWLF